MNKITMFITGSIVLILGMTLVLRHWAAVAIVFEGVLPLVLAVGGLVLMFAASLKK